MNTKETFPDHERGGEITVSYHVPSLGSQAQHLLPEQNPRTPKWPSWDAPMLGYLSTHQT